MSHPCPMDVAWRVSSKSNGTACVEVAKGDATILVRDTKNRARGMLTLPSTAWQEFIETIQADSISLT